MSSCSRVCNILIEKRNIESRRRLAEAPAEGERQPYKADLKQFFRFSNAVENRVAWIFPFGQICSRTYCNPAANVVPSAHGRGWTRARDRKQEKKANLGSSHDEKADYSPRSDGACLDDGNGRLVEDAGLLL